MATLVRSKLLEKYGKSDKRIIGFYLPREVIRFIKAEADEADCWPAHIIEGWARERMARKGVGACAPPLSPIHSPPAGKS
jgi:hypothetical protein